MNSRENGSLGKYGISHHVPRGYTEICIPGTMLKTIDEVIYVINEIVTDDSPEYRVFYLDIEVNEIFKRAEDIIKLLEKADISKISNAKNIIDNAYENLIDSEKQIYDDKYASLEQLNRRRIVI